MEQSMLSHHRLTLAKPLAVHRPFTAKPLMLPMQAMAQRRFNVLHPMLLA
jgi:hypothetical protein